MSKNRLNDLNIVDRKLLPTPAEVAGALPLSAAVRSVVSAARSEIKAVLSGRSRKLFMVVGPCSIHDVDAALEYGARLKELAERVQDRLLLIMRTYFEKPRTSVGWKGFINDPFLNDSFRIDLGLTKARRLLLDLSELGVPVGTEALDPIMPQYLDDLVAWNAIGARTVESQTHRELASGLSTPVGFKNGTDGSITAAVNALRAAAGPHHFLGIDRNGTCCIFQTAGNEWGHIVLRGGRVPNYLPADIAACETALAASGLEPRIMVDCSHGNSRKQPERQLEVLESCIRQAASGTHSIKALMLESNLHGGSQPLVSPDRLSYGVSITDACLDWESTEAGILRAYEVLAAG